MSLPAEFETAIKRLDAAMDQLEAALHRRNEQNSAKSNLDEEMSILQDDRSRLAVELDGALARGKTLASTNQEVARRLERAGSAIRIVLQQVEVAG